MMRRRLRGKARPGGAWQGWAGQCLVWPGEARFSTRNRYFVAVTGAGRGHGRSVVTILLDRILWGDPLPPPVPPDPPPEPDGG